VPAADDQYRPSPEDVGAITLNRTVDKVGVQTGTFTADTRPTDSQVEILIDKAMEDVSCAIGTSIPEGLWDRARHVVSIRTAMLIELTLYAHEIRSGVSPYPEYKALYEDEIACLAGAVAAAEAGQSLEDAFSNGTARWGFPPPTYIYTGVN
jgi:hypothetical protein